MRRARLGRGAVNLSAAGQRRNLTASAPSASPPSTSPATPSTLNTNSTTAGLATNSFVFCMLFEKPFICLGSRSMTPLARIIVLFLSSQQLSRLWLESTPRPTCSILSSFFDFEVKWRSYGQLKFLQKKWEFFSIPGIRKMIVRPWLMDNGAHRSYRVVMVAIITYAYLLPQVPLTTMD